MPRGSRGRGGAPPEAVAKPRRTRRTQAQAAVPSDVGPPAVGPSTDPIDPQPPPIQVIAQSPPGQPPATEAQEENFDLNVSGSEELESPEAQAAQAIQPPRQRTRRENLNEPEMPDVTMDLINQPSHSRSITSTTEDIRYFFFREKGSDTFCRKCKEEYDKDPRAWDDKYGKAVRGSRGRRNFYYSASTATSTLRKHLEPWHLLEYVIQARERSWVPQLSAISCAIDRGYSLESLEVLMRDDANLDITTLPMRASHANAGTTNVTERGTIPPFSKENFQRFLVEFIVADDQSLNVVECPEFRRLLLLLRGDLQDHDIPRRTKIRSEVIAAWQDSFASLRAELDNAIRAISFTADVWGDKLLQPYLALTAHWIAEHKTTGALELRSALIGFRRLRGNHTGLVLARTIIYLLDRAEVTTVSSLGWFTLDNASNNKTMMEELSRLLALRDIPFHAGHQRIMCFPHVINLCSQAILTAFDNPNQEVVDVTYANAFDDPAEKDRYVAAIIRRPISSGREIIRTIRSSGLRRDDFIDTIKSGNEKQRFKDSSGETVIVPEVQLLRDVPTRWDATFYMINRLRTLRLPVDLFLAIHKLTAVQINDIDWDIMRDCEAILQIPHRVQHTMCHESLPRLGKSIPSFELFREAWKRLSDRVPCLAPPIQVGLNKANLYYNRMENSPAYIVAMFVDPSVKLTWVTQSWDHEQVATVRADIVTMMSEYRASKLPEQATQVTTQPDANSLQALATQYGLDDVWSAPTPGSVRTVEREFEEYTVAPLWGTSDPLAFWVTARITYPTIFRIALDYLPIQASAVPCERVFSSSGETDTHKRNRISCTLMEALQMLKFKLKKDRLDFTRGMFTRQSELLQDDPDDPQHNPCLSQKDQLDQLLKQAHQDEKEVPDFVEVFPLQF